MKAITYLSVSAEAFGIEELDDLVATCMANNSRQSITGYLSYFKGRFVQYIEGEPAVVDEAMRAIRNDPRHKIVCEFETASLKYQRFPSWHMRFLSDSMRNSFAYESYIETNLLTLSMTRNPDLVRCKDLLNNHREMVSSWRDAVG